MKKILMTSAVAASCVLSIAAHADVTVYGQVENSITRVTASTGDVTTTDEWKVADHASRLGFKGSEDLGGGLKVIWKYEQAYDTDGAGAITAGRNAYVGLNGSFGTVLLGRHDTPHKTAWYASGVDLLGNSVADMNHDGRTGDDTGAHHYDERRQDNNIVYFSPNLSGFKVAVSMAPGETTDVDDGLADTWSAAVMYKGGGLKFGAGYESAADGVADTPDEKRMHVSGTYAFDNITLGGSYATVEDDANVEGDEKETLGIVGQIKFDKNAIGANYRNSDITNAADGNSDLDSWAFWVSHSLSKRTRIYFAAAQHERDVAGGSANDQETEEYSVGLFHKF